MPPRKRRTPAERALDEAGRLTIAIEALNVRARTLASDRDRLILYAYEEAEGSDAITYPMIADRVGVNRARVIELLRRVRAERAYEDGEED